MKTLLLEALVIIPIVAYPLPDIYMEGAMSHRIESFQVFRPESAAVTGRACLAVAVGLLAGFGISFALTARMPMKLRMGVVGGAMAGGALLGLSLGSRLRRREAAAPQAMAHLSSRIACERTVKLGYERPLPDGGSQGATFMVNPVAIARSPVLAQLLRGDSPTIQGSEELTQQGVQGIIDYCHEFRLKLEGPLWPMLRAARVLQMPELQRRLEIELTLRRRDERDLEEAARKGAILLERHCRAEALLFAEKEDRTEWREDLRKAIQNSGRPPRVNLAPFGYLLDAHGRLREPEHPVILGQHRFHAEVLAIAFPKMGREKLERVPSGLLWNYLYRGELPDALKTEDWLHLFRCLDSAQRSIVESDVMYHLPLDRLFDDEKAYVETRVPVGADGLGGGMLRVRRDPIYLNQGTLDTLVQVWASGKANFGWEGQDIQGLTITDCRLDAPTLTRLLSSMPRLQCLEIRGQTPQMPPQALARAIGVANQLRQLTLNQPIDYDELSLTTPQLTHLTVVAGSRPGPEALARWQEGLQLRVNY
jgi:hypothetical protein